ncbi:hypothetical protein IFHNHDMJ_03200 [Synechococcus sp. CBW1107]|nr:hypothetical protein IFHNHDMJ_03200 [Synechococcus sp. CBW1107]
MTTTALSDLHSNPMSDAAAAEGFEPMAPEVSLRDGDDDRVRRYASTFADLMEMRAPAEQVGRYLDRHEGWFRRCAAPMTVQPHGSNGYVLTLGRFGNFGFEVEPTIGLELLPQAEGVYRIVTLPPQVMAGTGLEGLYDVDFNAALRLDETTPENEEDGPLTLVRWELDLSVWIRLPKVITLLPDSLVQSSGDHLLRQIVRQISRRLTWKVQEDFHATHGLACPPRRRAQF